MDSTGPFLHHILSHQVQHFHQGIVIREDCFAFGHLPQLAMVTFDDIGCVDDFTDLRRVFEESGQLRPIVPPGTDNQRIFVSPEDFKFIESF